jgi:hypothetical protein
MQLALGFGEAGREASAVARRSLQAGFERAARSYADGWHDYLGDLRRPRSVAGMENSLRNAALWGADAVLFVASLPERAAVPEMQLLPSRL